MEVIKTISTILGTVISFITVLGMINKFTNNALMKWLQKPVLDVLNEHSKQLKDLTVDNLKLIIMCNDIPLSERIVAGEKYLSLGGNGAIHVQHDLNVVEYKKQLENKEG